MQGIGPIVMEAGTLGNEDIFMPINMAGCILLSERAAELLRSQGFTNFRLVPINEWTFESGQGFGKEPN